MHGACLLASRTVGSAACSVFIPSGRSTERSGRTYRWLIALVAFATDDPGSAGRLTDALTNPRLNVTVSLGSASPSTAPGFRKLTVKLPAVVDRPGAALANKSVTITAVPATTYYRTAGEQGSSVNNFEDLGVTVGTSLALTMVASPCPDGVYVVLRMSNVTR